MLGHLVPCSGGKSIPLRSDRVYLGRRPHTDRSLPLGQETALCRLRRSGGWWHADDLGGGAIRVNGRLHPTIRVNPSDELSIGKMRFRVIYEPPESDEQLAEAVAADVLGESPIVSPGPTETSTAVAGRATTVRQPDSGTESPVGKPEKIHFQAARLVPLGGGPDFLVSQPKVTIGRKQHCDIVLPFSTISSMHCGLEFVDGYWRALDLGSRNGIRIDGVRCQKAWVYPDSRLSIADRRFELDYVPQGERPEPEETSPVYSKPLIATLGMTSEQMDKSLARYNEEEQDEPQRKRYDLLEDL